VNSNQSIQPGTGCRIPGSLGFGGAPLGNLFTALSDDQAADTIQAAWESGLRYFDTAPFYGTGLSEKRIGNALRQHPRDEFVLSTKVGRLLVPDSSVPQNQNGYVGGLPNRVEYDYSADGVRRSIDDSLARLGFDRLDVVYIHDLAEDTHGEDWLRQYSIAMDGAARALSDLRTQGVIGGWGLGVNCIEPCLKTLADSDPDVFLLAGRYTLLDTSALDAFLPACDKRGVRVLVGGPYNSGLLAGGTTFEYAQAPSLMVQRAERIAAHCARFDVSLKAAALQFCKAPPAVALVIAGARNAVEVQENSRLMKALIPAELWSVLKGDGLIPQGAPEPLPAR
jgi:D-threo-aldose 1-dehydrogenase